MNNDETTKPETFRVSNWPSVFLKFNFVCMYVFIDLRLERRLIRSLTGQGVATPERETIWVQLNRNFCESNNGLYTDDLHRAVQFFFFVCHLFVLTS